MASNQTATALTDEPAFAVHVEPEGFTRTEKGTISGVVYIKVGNNYAFPDDRWRDVVVDDLNLWLSNALVLHDGTGNHRECWFMDGGFQFDIEAQSDGHWLIRFLDTRREEAVIEREEVFEPSVVIEALLEAAEVTLKTCRERGWSAVRLDDLAANYATLNQPRGLPSPVAA